MIVITALANRHFMQAQTAEPIKDHIRHKSNLEIDAVHAIHKINYYTKGICPGASARTVLPVVAEMVCYFFAISVVYFSLNIHQLLASDSIYLKDAFPNVSRHTEQRAFLLNMLRAELAASAVLLLLVGFLIRKIKAKNRTLRKVKTRARDFLERYRFI